MRGAGCRVQGARAGLVGAHRAVEELEVTGSMCEHMLKCDTALGDWLVELDAALIDKAQHREGYEQLAHLAELEGRVSFDWKRVLP